MADLDYTGSRSLREALDGLDRDHVGFAVARAGAHLRDNLARCGLLERIGTERFFDSVDAAVTALGRPAEAEAEAAEAEAEAEAEGEETVVDQPAPGAEATVVDQPAPGAEA